MDDLETAETSDRNLAFFQQLFHQTGHESVESADDELFIEGKFFHELDHTGVVFHRMTSHNGFQERCHERQSHEYNTFSRKRRLRKRQCADVFSAVETAVKNIAAKCITCRITYRNKPPQAPSCRKTFFP